MRPRRLVFWAVAAALAALLLTADPDARGDPVPIVPVVPTLPGGGLGRAALGAVGGGLVVGAAGGQGGAGLSGGGLLGGPGIVATLPNLAPATAGIFLCPGVGAAGSAIGGGGGYCDFDFIPVALSATGFGVMHIHCEWGGFVPIVEMWSCWRVWPGQPDHPAHPDPDIVPDGWGVPWAINGPSPSDQWPPPGLAPASTFAPPPEPAPPEPGPPPEPAPGPPAGPPPPAVPPPPIFPPWDMPTPPGSLTP
jgi:hypothetical protein